MNPESAPSPSGNSVFLKLFTTGLAGLIVGWLVLFGLSFPIANPQSVAVAGMWAISHWWIAFIVGAVALLIRAFTSGQKPGAAFIAYLAPAVVLAILCGIFLAIYPEPSFRGELLELMPLTLVFYLLGLAWVGFTKSKSGKDSFLRSVIPPTVGGGIVAVMVAFPVFTGNAFTYRNAFDFAVTKVNFADGKMTVEGTLAVLKPGEFSFFAPRFSYFYSEGGAEFDSILEFGAITWGAAGPPKNGETGSHPFEIRWEKNTPSSLAELHGNMSEENSIFLEVHKPGSEPNELIYNLVAPIPGANP